mgnify:CR=1 FL=1
MNTYAKYCPNVFVAKCEQEHQKGDIIEMTTKYGKSHECIVFNLVATINGFFYYSIVRADGYNVQERAKAKAERLKQWASNAHNKSEQYYNVSHSITKNIPLGQPILVGHHSEKRHRRDIEKSWNAMGKGVEMSNKANEYGSRAEYWEKQSNVINLSMPESLEYYEYKLQEAKDKHDGMKNGSIEKDHHLSIVYAKKQVNEIEKKLKTAQILWA